MKMTTLMVVILFLVLLRIDCSAVIYEKPL
jgi:hypothetical protein